CDLGGFGILEVSLQTDGHPADNAVRVMCNGSQALRIDGAEARWPTNSVVRVPITLDAGLTCQVIVEEKIGDRGPGGRVKLCGEEVASWLLLPAQSQDYERVVAEVEIEACSGCTNPNASNYDPAAYVEDGSCVGL